jgi:hypothetical protein
MHQSSVIPNPLLTTADRFIEGFQNAWALHPPPCRKGLSRMHSEFRNQNSELTSDFNLPCDRCPIYPCAADCPFTKQLRCNLET